MGARRGGGRVGSIQGSRGGRGVTAGAYRACRHSPSRGSAEVDVIILPEPTAAPLGSHLQVAGKSAVMGALPVGSGGWQHVMTRL